MPDSLRLAPSKERGNHSTWRSPTCDILRPFLAAPLETSTLKAAAAGA